MLNNKAITHFGTTSNFLECGYITPDGSMLDFSGKKFGGNGGHRDMDHREISDIYEVEIEGTEAMIDFMNKGNIRVNSESQGLDISNKNNLTEEQKQSIRDYSNYFKGDIFVDISDSKGKNIQTLEYKEKTSSSRILSDIVKSLNL